MSRTVRLDSGLNFISGILKGMTQKYFTWIVFALLTGALFGCGAKPASVVIQTDSPLREVGPDLPEGSLQKAISDWRESERQAEQVDPFARSYANVWVRMFPLPEVPSSDPFANTQNEKNLLLENSSGMYVMAADTDQKIINSPVKKLFFDFAKGNIQADGQNYKLETVKILPVDVNTLTQASWDILTWPATPQTAKEIRTRLRGVFLVKKANVNGGKGSVADRHAWSLINILHINQYLRAVVPSEVAYSWNENALQAQAIAARTYVLREMMESRELNHMEWDVDPSTWYQAYRGTYFYFSDTKNWVKIEQASTDASVAATYDQVMAYQGQVIMAFFSANSGGVTCSVTECFGGTRDLPYLIAKSDVEGVQKESGGVWGSKANLSASSIKNILLQLGYKSQDTVVGLEHLEKGPSGRTWRLQVKMSSGSIIALSRAETKKMMTLFGSVRSYLYQLGNGIKNAKQSIAGYGFGHGVGMSQVGAKILGERGHSAIDIMQFYYPGAYVQPLLAR